MHVPHLDPRLEAIRPSSPVTAPAPLTTADEDDQLSQATLASEFEDFKVLGDLQSMNRKELFDDQFMAFIRWFKKDIYSRYTKADFRRIERHNFLLLVGGYLAVFAMYLLCHAWLSTHPLLWGVPLFLAAVWVMKRVGVIHMRAHSPQNLTGVWLFDRMIDVLGLASCGVSTNVFKRRHLAAHYNDIGNFSRLFSTAWLTFDNLPACYYLKPYLLIKFLCDKEFCRVEKIDRRLLLLETLFFYAYYAAVVFELFALHSYFLLVFHMAPSLLIASSQILGAVIVHSGIDKRNSFDSNGLFDPKKLTGLFRVSTWFNSLLSDHFTINHGIHHAYPPLPLSIINAEYEHYHAHILAHYDNVRLNQVLTHRMHGNILERLPAPTWFDRAVTLGLAVLAHLCVCLTIMGLPFPPNVFERLLVDYRLYLYSTRRERRENFVRFMDSMHFAERWAETPDPNTYLRFFYRRYQRYQAYLAATA
jgi:hypothetical protein